MAQSIRIEGLRELDKALGQLPRATGKNVLRRVARKALEPIIEDAKGKAPVGIPGPGSGGKLRDSLAVSTKLSRRQKALHKKMFPSQKSSVEVFGGVGAHAFVPQGVMQEFGTRFHGPQPFLRPAWDSGKNPALNSVKRNLWAEIKKAAERVARKQARLLAKGGR